VQISCVRSMHSASIRVNIHFFQIPVLSLAEKGILIVTDVVHTRVGSEKGLEWQCSYFDDVSTFKRG